MANLFRFFKTTRWRLEKKYIMKLEEIQKIIQQRLAETGQKQSIVALNATGQNVAIADIMRGRMPNVARLDAILKELDCYLQIITPEDNQSQSADFFTQIPIFGTLEPTLPNHVKPSTGYIDVPLAFKGCVAIIIAEGFSMYPAYYLGDAVLFMPSIEDSAETVMGRDAVCFLRNGKILLQRVVREVNFKFVLESHHAGFAPVTGATVKKFHRVIGSLKNVQPIDLRQPENHQNISGNISIDNNSGDVNVQKVNINNVQGNNQININNNGK